MTKETAITFLYGMRAENLNLDDAYTRDRFNALTLAITSLENPQAKTAHWIDIPKYKDIAWRCSKCEYFTTVKHNFCPDCGRKIVEPQESEG